MPMSLSASNHSKPLQNVDVLTLFFKCLFALCVEPLYETLFSCAHSFLIILPLLHNLEFFSFLQKPFRTKQNRNYNLLLLFCFCE